jgi:hypothetical protein
MTSSFFCVSPCTFCMPAAPWPSASAPLLTRVLIALQARATARAVTSATPAQVTAMPASESALGTTPNIRNSSTTAKMG